MVNVSRQKIYNSLIYLQKQYPSFDHLVLFVSYIPFQGLRLNVRIKNEERRKSWVNNTLEVSDCLKKKNIFEMADAIATEVEIWLKRNDLN